jgi:hypothetical protein
VERGARDSGVTLAELLAAFSLATDLGLGQPMEHVLQSWRIACRLAERVGLAEEERCALFFIATPATPATTEFVPQTCHTDRLKPVFPGHLRKPELRELLGS